MAAHWRTGPVADISAHMVERAHRRYGLTAYSPEVAAAWSGMVASVYSQDVGVQDPTGIPHLPGSASQFAADRHTPSPLLCTTWASWGALLAAAPAVGDLTNNEPFRYDLVNLGREVLAQLSTPVSMNFSDALNAGTLHAATLNATGSLYIELLSDVDALVGTDSAFMLGPWLAAARRLANGSDCNAGAAPGNPGTPMGCGDFMEWNARCQITTWNPTPKGASKVPDGPVDYSSRHYSGLISDYYAARAAGILKQALADAAAGRPLDKAAVEAFKAQLANTWQNAYPSAYPLAPTADAVAVSTAMRAKWARFFAPTCGA
jgi:alpha-N-acetylglucosaminidase